MSDHIEDFETFDPNEERWVCACCRYTVYGEEPHDCEQCGHICCFIREVRDPVDGTWGHEHDFRVQEGDDPAVYPGDA